MECLYYYGGSRKHLYEPYKTLLLRRDMYRCARCGNKITKWQYHNWQDMWKERERLLRYWTENR